MGDKKRHIDTMVDSTSNKLLRMSYEKTTTSTALETCYKDNISPILDAINSLNLTQETIPLPTDVVIGDQSSGKSSLLESLTGISLPLYSRVQLIMKLQNHMDLEPEFVLQFHHNEKFIEKFIEESEISKAISNAMSEIEW